MLKKILLTLVVLGLLSANTSYVFAASNDSNEAFTKLRTVDIGTFNEYRYRLTEEFFNLRNDFEVSGIVKDATIIKIYKLTKESYNYLPDNLINKNLYKKVEIALAKAVKYPGNESMYQQLVDALDRYLEKVNIKSIKGSVKATPKIGNAPLNVSLRGVVKDETGTKIPSYNYIWWIDDAGKRKIIGNEPSINYVFRDEGTFSVFLDVISSHKNSKSYTDVLPFRSRADITIKEKIASLIIKVNGDNLRNKDELKYTPDEASYGLVFDATSSTPTGGAKFTRTDWDFGNGIEKSNDGEPQIERIKYIREGDYTVTLKLRTNEGKTVERKFVISINDPIATVSASKTSGFLGDKFTFSAKPTGSDDDFSYDWEIINIDTDKEIFSKSGKTFSYTFPKKGKYNVKLKVTEPSGQIDIDTQIIYINSRAPVSVFTATFPYTYKPNTALLDASKSYDLDGVDDGKLSFEWIIDGTKVELDSLNYNGSVGYYTFDSIKDKSVLLRVTDPEGISAQITKKVNVSSILALDFSAYPRVTQRETPIYFEANSPEARVFAWDFGDGKIYSGRKSQATHKYTESGIYTVKLTVTDSNDTTNTYSKKVYIGESNAPLANIKISNAQKKDVSYERNVCYGNGAYIVDRASAVTFDAGDSIDVTGKKGGLSYSWKLGYNKYYSSPSFTQKFDELGCSQIQLTVKSDTKGATSKIKQWVKVVNLKPTLSSVDVQVVDGDADPVVVKISALGAKDPDGVIQSYLWYYYTDIDPEPQDFRATKQANTTFVLPKVTGNYYFVVLMKDNNEARISSETITGSKYFITLTGDNINVPLVKLSVNDSTITVGQEVVFNVDVENILGSNLSKKAQYSWDLDGDGFYEQKTNTPSIAYTYDRSGEFYAKVKAKYKGYSNTKSITMNVSNLLKPDVEYISIGNKFVFFDTSIGKSDTSEWNLGDGTTIKNAKTTIYTYEDNKGSHAVSLELKEGIKMAKETFVVSRNMRNILHARKKGINIFSNKIISQNIIALEKSREKIFIYLGESKSENEREITDFTVDLDINYDSNLNGGKDDDKDISFAFGQNDNIFQIKLNESKDQTIKITAYNIDGDIITTKELLVTKNYLDDDEIDINSIIFKGITNSERLTIEKLKTEIKKLPKEYRLKSLMYIQKMQEEWFDAGERIKVIVEFEGYISSVEMSNAAVIFDLLKELVLMNEDDKSEKNLIFVALKELTPVNIECELSSDIKDATCYDTIIERLNIIKVNIDIDQNKVLAKEILEAIGGYPDMTVNEKNNYKAILSSFIYGGTDNIPEVEKQAEIQKDNNTGNDGSTDSTFLGVLGTIAWIFGIIIGIFLGFFVLFFLWYKISNKNDHIGFQDFIIEKTSGKKAPIITKQDDTQDILSELDAELSKPTEKEKEVKIENNIKSDISVDVNKKTEKNISDEKIETNKDEVPDWLKGNFSDNSSDKKIDNNKKEPKEIIQKEKNKSTNTFEKNSSENKNSQNKKPWDSKGKNNGNKFGGGNKNQNKFSNKGNNFGKNNIPSEEKPKEENNSDMPDWLKGIDEPIKSSQEKSIIDTNKGEKNISDIASTPDNKGENSAKKTKINSKEELDTITKIEEDSNIPDWLKGSFVEEKIEEKKVEDKKVSSENKEEKKSQVKDNFGDKPEDKKSDITKENKELTSSDKKEETLTPTKDSNIPDWLKGSFDEVKKQEKQEGSQKEEIKIDNSKGEKILENGEEILEVKDAEINKEVKEEELGEKIKERKILEKKSKIIETPQKIEEGKSNTDDEKITVTHSEDIEEKVVLVVDKKEVSLEGKSVEKKKTTVKKETVKKSVTQKETKKQPKQTEKKVTPKKVVEDKIQEKKSTPKKVTSKEKQKSPEKETPVKKTSVKKIEKTSVKEEQPKESKTTNDELWDDGMKIPDWLKTDDDK